MTYLQYQSVARALLKNAFDYYDGLSTRDRKLIRFGFNLDLPVEDTVQELATELELKP